MKIYMIRQRGVDSYYGCWDSLSKENLCVFVDYEAKQTRSTASIWGAVQGLAYNIRSAIVDEISYKTRIGQSVFDRAVIDRIELKMGNPMVKAIKPYMPTTPNSVVSWGWSITGGAVDEIIDIIICCILDELEVAEIGITKPKKPSICAKETILPIEDFVTKKMQKTYSKYQTISGNITPEDLK